MFALEACGLARFGKAMAASVYPLPEFALFFEFLGSWTTLLYEGDANFDVLYSLAP